MPDSAGRLSGRCVLLTRPRAESAALASRIAQAGGTALVFPTLEIQPLTLSPTSAAALAALPEMRLAVFVSTNAVRYGLPLIRARGGWPAGLAAAAVGTATARMLQEEGVGPVWVPETGGDSEALLALPALRQVSGWGVVVFRGAGGRELLADMLRSRGAQVSYVECYRRAMPRSDPKPVQEALHNGRLAAVVAASAEGVRNLLEMVGPQWQQALRRLALVVTHRQVAEAARNLGFEQVLLAGDAYAGVVKCLEEMSDRHA